MDFREFLLNEQRAYLGQKVGDILTAVQDLRDDAKSMGSKNLVRYAEKVVNQIRRVLHTHWSREETKHLKALQKVGVALMKAIEERDDLEGTITSASQELEKLSGRLGVPLHQLGTSTKDMSGPENAPDEEDTPPEHSGKGSQSGQQPPGGPQAPPPPGGGSLPGTPPGLQPMGAPAPGGPPAGANPVGAPPSPLGL
jgi:hypothetical protein